MPEVPSYISDKLESLKVRILGGIFIIFFLAIAMVMYGVWTYQRDKLVTLTSQKAIQLSDVIIAGLRSSMLQNDREETMRSINTILQAAGSERISILNTHSRIKMTSDPKLVGKVVDKMTDPSCRECHASGKRMARTAVVEVAGERFINTVTAIRVEPACYGCHPKDKKVIGILLVESSFSETEAILEQMEGRIALTGFIAFIIGALLINYIVTRFFTRPLEILQKGFEQVGHGDFTYWVDVNCGGEIGYMADSFNVMSRAIGRFVNEINVKTEEVGAHYAIVNDLSQTIDKKKLKEVVVELLYRLLKADCATLALAVDNHPKMFEVVRMRSEDKRHYHDYFNTDSDDLDMCALTREDLVALRKGNPPSVSYSKDGSKLVISLVHKKMALGLVSVIKPATQSFSEAEKKIIPVLVHHITLSLANAQLYHIAITDGLTTLYTKRHFEKKINDFIHNFHVTKRGFCLLLLDLDHFKQVNDEHGHPVGDKVLVQVADLIRSTIRHGDIPFRYGGEEFTILLQGDDIEGAVRISERVRRSMEGTVLQIADIPPFSKTVSIGVACFPHHYTTAEELITAADKALYKAKRNGRNQVIVYCRDTYGEPDCGSYE
jgi:diguanylate cyclase (GGDEF)-like protein